MEKTVLRVDGMSCEHCVKAVTKATTALDSVKGVKVDLKAGTVSLEYDPAKIPLASIKAAIEEEGYEIK